MSSSARIKTWLGRRTIILWVAVLAVLITSPSLWGRFAADDHFIRLVLTGTSEVLELQRSAYELFVFSRGDLEEERVHWSRGVYPWWSVSGGKLAFWRPLAALSHRADFALYPDSPFLMHLKNLLWYAVVAAAAALLFRRLIEPAWVAGLAAVLFAVDDAHSMAAGWLANRNGVMATAFGILAVCLHDGWRRSGRKANAFLAPVCLLAGLCCGEAAIAAGGYLVAYAFFIDRGPKIRRLLALVPYGLVTLPWLLIYRLQGYGTQGSGLYNDPLTEPLLFLREGIQRLPVLLLGQLGTPSSSIWPFLPSSLALAQLVGGLAFIAFVAWVLWPMLKRDPRARFWATGMVLSTLPFCATFPNDRLLFFTGLGGMALVALFFQSCLEPTPWHDGASRRRSRRVLAVVWVATHCIFSPLWTPPSSLTMSVIDRGIARGCEAIPDGPDAANTDVVIVNSPSDFLSFYVPVMRAAEGIPLPRRMWTLTAGTRPIDVTRSGPRELTVHAEEGLLEAGWCRLARGQGYPMAPGYTVKLAAMTAEVVTVTADGRPVDLRFSFAASLDDPSLRFLTWREDRFVSFELPEVGETVHVPAIPRLFMVKDLMGTRQP